ncbi:MAG TPA: hypothetical protein VHB21_10170 [Minicystis sp.]|nr:hypothetical protein [Minicystis sp.]
MHRFIGTALACLALGALGCSGSAPANDSGGSGGAGGGATTGAGGSSEHPDVKDVLFFGGATPEELTQLLDATPKTDAKRLPKFTSPAPVSEYVWGDAAPTFTWKETGPAPASSGARERTLLLFGAPGEPALLRVFTGASSFHPDQAAWKKVSIGTWVTVGIFSAGYVDGELEGDVGEGATIQFCSMPKGATGT